MANIFRKLRNPFKRKKKITSGHDDLGSLFTEYPPYDKMSDIKFK